MSPKRTEVTALRVEAARPEDGRLAGADAPRADLERGDGIRPAAGCRLDEGTARRAAVLL